MITKIVDICNWTKDTTPTEIVLLPPLSRKYVYCFDAFAAANAAVNQPDVESNVNSRYYVRVQQTDTVANSYFCKRHIRLG